jgi:hypothetical protein
MLSQQFVECVGIQRLQQVVIETGLAACPFILMRRGVTPKPTRWPAGSRVKTWDRVNEMNE